VVDLHGHRYGWADTAQLLQNNDSGQMAQACSTVFLGGDDAANTYICHGFYQLFYHVFVGRNGILGEEESCCGDPARRMGNEYLFQLQAMKNIETFKRYGVKRIVVTCPHGYNMLKNEYPQFEGEFEVVHHSQYIAELIKQGRLKLKNSLAEKITYHDACYLGRHNDVYVEPRQVVKAIPGAQFAEMARRRSRSFCCGAGGGHMWMEETVGSRISEMRTEQALDTKSSILATACPNRDGDTAIIGPPTADAPVSSSTSTDRDT